MEPTLPDGCSILVDHRRLNRRKGLIYVLQTDGSLMVKRAGRDRSGRWQLLSDNPYWPPAPWPDGAQVIGEVRWSARTFPGGEIRVGANGFWAGLGGSLGRCRAVSLISTYNTKEGGPEDPDLYLKGAF